MLNNMRISLRFIGAFLCMFIISLSGAGCSAVPKVFPPTPTQTPTATQSLCPGGQPSTAIAAIQGRQHRSPLEGKSVTCVFGIVTAVRADGFYLQDPLGDGDDATSEGLFVTGVNVRQLKKGDAVVAIGGLVREVNPAGPGENSLTTTTLQSQELKVLSSENALPAAVVLGEGGRAIPEQVICNDVNRFASRSGLFDPEEDGLDFYESLEGMLVQVNNALAVSVTETYREVAVVADGGKDASLLSDRSVLVLREQDYNPERLILDDMFINMPDILPGAQFIQPIVAVVDYSFGNFKLEPVEKLKFKQGSPTVNAARDPSSSELVVATYNVENLSAVDDAQRFDLLAAQIVNDLHSPDILALEEVQDDDGPYNSPTTSAAQTIEKIIAAVTKAGGPKYRYLNIDPQRNADGGQEGANIRTVILYRTDRGLKLARPNEAAPAAGLQVIENNAQALLRLNPGRIGQQTSAFTQSRKPLVAQFIYKDKNLFIIAVHLNSKGEDDPLFGDRQPPQLFSEVQRQAQAKLIRNFVGDLLAAEPAARVIVLGDFNDFSWSLPLRTLKESNLSDLIEVLPEESRFSYIYEGNAQALDHVLVSPVLKESVSLFSVIHLNAEFLPAERLSDHDPLLVYFEE